MTKATGYSYIIRPALYVLDLAIISILSHYFLTQTIFDLLAYALIWFTLSVTFSLYKVYRFTKLIKILALLFRQLILFSLSVLSYLYITNSNLNNFKISRFFVAIFIAMIIWRVLLFFFFRNYRAITGSNYKKVVIIGDNNATKKLQKFFKKEKGYGYNFQGFFTNNQTPARIGNIETSFDFILKNNIDELYCSLKEISDSELKKYIEFCNINSIILKFIPDDKDLYTKNLQIDYYDILPVLSLKKIPLQSSLNSAIKRTFDIIFSTLVILLLLSWLIPILGLIIVLESRGPIFFKQNRPGIQEKGFNCYKFRSMTLNKRSEESATRNDSRVTKVGKFIRRTSIDELPQFFNVLFGSMSVVGPRPHLWKQNEKYGKKVSKYMLRHYISPGVTGLAQVRGYRGEIETKEDIVNRIKYDIFYLENWSLLLDINIIVRTILNMIKGDDKAY